MQDETRDTRMKTNIKMRDRTLDTLRDLARDVRERGGPGDGVGGWTLAEHAWEAGVEDALAHAGQTGEQMLGAFREVAEALTMTRAPDRTVLRRAAGLPPSGSLFGDAQEGVDGALELDWLRSVLEDALREAHAVGALGVVAKADRQAEAGKQAAEYEARMLPAVYELTRELPDATLEEVVERARSRLEMGDGLREQRMAPGEEPYSTGEADDVAALITGAAEAEEVCGADELEDEVEALQRKDLESFGTGPAVPVPAGERLLHVIYDKVGGAVESFRLEVGEADRGIREFRVYGRPGPVDAPPLPDDLWENLENISVDRWMEARWRTLPEGGRGVQALRDCYEVYMRIDDTPVGPELLETLASACTLAEELGAQTFDHESRRWVAK